MKYKTDGGGFATSCDDIKIFGNGSTWATKLSQLAKSTGNLIIMTYGFKVRTGKYATETLEDEHSYIREILDKRPTNIFILCNSNSIDDAKIIKRLYPQIRIRHHKSINANIALLEPQTVIFSSEEFGFSDKAGYGVGFHSNEIYEEMIKQFRLSWEKSEEI